MGIYLWQKGKRGQGQPKALMTRSCWLWLSLVALRLPGASLVPSIHIHLSCGQSVRVAVPHRTVLYMHTPYSTV